MPPRDLSRSLQRTLTHLLPPASKGGKFAAPIPTHFRPNPRFVQVKDRIPYWQIAPGDKVVLIKGDKRVKGKSGIVDAVDRESNRVSFRENEFKTLKRQPNSYPGESTSKDFTGADSTVLMPKWYHVSNVRLQLTLEEDNTTHTVTRMRRSAPTWNRKLGRFDWKRMGLIPALTGEDNSGWRTIPWPKEGAVDKGSAGPLDADSTLAFSESWIPSLDSLSLNATSSEMPPELLVNPLDLSSGPYSRARQTQRWNDKREEERLAGQVWKGKGKGKGRGGKKDKLDDVLL